MDKIKNWWVKYRPTTRRLVQLYAALLTNAHAKGYITGEIYTGNLKNMCVPGLNCYSCPGAVGACPLGALQNALASTGNRAPTYMLGILMLYALTLGRTICGWLCPMGLIQDLLHKLPTPKLQKSRITRVLSWFKYVILVVLVGIIPLSYSVQKFPVPGFCKYICPAGTLEGAMGLLANPVNADKFSMLGILFTRKFVILVLVITACIFIYRAFCRFLCPLGAIYGLFNRICLLGVKVNPCECTHCGRCVAQCQMDIGHVADRECIHCGKCVDVCPTKAISWKGGKVFLKDNEVDAKPGTSGKGQRRRAIAWCAALLLLVGVTIYVNQPDANASVPVGKEVGMHGYEFTAPLYLDGGEFRLADSRGKVTVINFWATWCTPCVAELPHFQKVYETWPEDVQVVAIHHCLVTDDVDAFLNGEGLNLPFALDEDGSIVEAYGGSSLLPQTIILDREGNITYNQVGSVTFEKLKALIEEIL